jgi:putative ABC transport system ATP-binding protein
MINHPQVLLADEPTGNLDSHTSEEILREFQKINQEHGQTIVMVTHDANIAAYAGRQIIVRDGLIESDSAEPQGGREEHARGEVLPLSPGRRSGKTRSSRAR